MPSGVEVPLARHPTAAREARRLLRDQFSNQLDQEDTTRVWFQLELSDPGLAPE
jgi:hypothetical protein